MKDLTGAVELKVVYRKGVQLVLADEITDVTTAA